MLMLDRISDSNSSGVLQNVSFNNMIFPGQPMPVQKDSDKHLQQRIVAMQATPWCHGLLDLTVSCCTWNLETD